MPQSPFSIVFCGTPEFAVPSLQALIDDDAFSVDLVITQPDKPVGRKQELTPSPIKTLALKHGLQIEQPEDINAFHFPLSTFHFLIVVAYGQILRQTLLDLPQIAPVNVHASLLPRWRGSSPMQHSLLAGDATTGISIQKMVRKLDAGSLLAQREEVLEERETIETLHDRLSIMGADLLVETLKGPLKETPQDGEISVCKKLSRASGEVDPQSMTAGEIDRYVRALVPWPGVTCEVDGDDVKLLEAFLEERVDSIPLSCAKGSTLHIGRMQSPGKRILSGADWARGRRINGNDYAEGT